MSAENQRQRPDRSVEAGIQRRQIGAEREGRFPKEIQEKEVLDPTDLSSVISEAEQRAETEFARDHLESDLTTSTSPYAEMMHSVAVALSKESRRGRWDDGHKQDWRDAIGRLKPPQGFLLKERTLLDTMGEPVTVGLWHQEQKKRNRIGYPIMYQQRLSPDSHHEMLRIATDDTGSVSCIELSFGVTGSEDGVQTTLPADVFSNLKDLAPTVEETLETAHAYENTLAAWRDLKPGRTHQEYFSLTLDLSSLNKRWTLSKEGSFLDLENKYVISQNTENPQEEAEKYAELVGSVLRLVPQARY